MKAIAPFTLPRCGVTLSTRINDMDVLRFAMRFIYSPEEYEEFLADIKDGAQRIQDEWKKEADLVAEQIDDSMLPELQKEYPDTPKERLKEVHSFNQVWEQKVTRPMLGLLDDRNYQTGLAFDIVNYFPILLEEGYVIYSQKAGIGTLNLDIEDRLKLVEELIKAAFSTIQETKPEVEVAPPVAPKVETKKAVVSPNILAYKASAPEEVVFPLNVNKAMAQSNLDNMFED